MGRIDKAGGPTRESIEREEIVLPSNALVEQIEKSLLISYMLGLSHASPDIELADSNPEEIPFEEALDYMKARVPMTKKEWTELEPKLRFRAFTIAALSQADGIEQVRQSLISAVGEGKTFSEFWNEATAIESAGLGSSSPWYWETVYRTNLQTVYNTGRAAEIKKSQPEYLELVGIDDERQTEICRRVSGTILPASHPFWKKYWPPLHFGCRTTVRSVFREEIEAMRDKHPEWTPMEEAPDVAPAKGFGSNPLDTGSYWEMTDKMAGRASAYGIMPDIKKYAKDLGLNGIRLFNAPDSQDYRTIVPLNGEGGSLSVHTSYGKKVPKEAGVGKVIAEQGYEVNVLPKSGVLKSPDLRIDGEIWEVKTPTSFTDKSIDRDLRGASKQSENVLLDLGSQDLSSDMKRGVKDRVLRNGEEKIKKVMIVAGKKITTYSRGEIEGW